MDVGPFSCAPSLPRALPGVTHGIGWLRSPTSLQPHHHQEMITSSWFPQAASPDEGDPEVAAGGAPELIGSTQDETLLCSHLDGSN